VFPLLLAGGSAAAEPDAISALRVATGKFCAAGEDIQAWARALDAQEVRRDRFAHAINVEGWRGTLRLPGGAEIRYIDFRQRGRMVRLSLEYHARSGGYIILPLLATAVGPGCRISGGRGIRYDTDGRPEWLDHYGGDLAAVRHTEPLNPPIPPGRDPGGVTVALFDSGVNYTLPHIARALARDADGRPLGYDYWDLDDRPFDGNPAASPFAPQRHGTEIAGIVLQEGPGIRLIPYRYPRPDMKRLADMVAAADRNGAVIVGIPMGSNREEDWLAFLGAARAHPHILFVISAGNNDRDIDRTPVYPAASSLRNGLVVTSCEESGWRARGSNWGRNHVDIMIPAENVPVIRFDGGAGLGSGSSHAVARVVALAARLLKRNPDWRAAELKAAILERATPAPQRSVSRHGWIPAPTPRPSLK